MSSVTFPCYVRVLDAFRAERKDQLPLKKGEIVRVLLSDESGRLSRVFAMLGKWCFSLFCLFFSFLLKCSFP